MDFIPISLIKYCSTVFSEIIFNPANLSISQGFFPLKFKLIQVTPLLKKHGLGKNTPSNYRHIYNLNNISKLLEHFILSRIQHHTRSSCNFNPFQSAYRRYYSTESALLLALDNIYHATDECSSTVLISLDLSTAFDTIDYTILLSELQTRFGISGLALARFNPYLEGRSQFVRIGCSTSPVTLCTTGFLQGSVLGPMLVYLFISTIAHIVSSYHILQHQYVYDTPLCVAIFKDNYDTPVAKLELCISTLHTWFCYNGLALNLDKSEAIVFVTSQGSRSLPIISTVNVAGTFVQVSNQVRILGVILDSRLSLDAHMSALSKACFYHIYALCHTRPNLTLDCFKNIACSLVGRRLDYANLTFVGILV